MTSFSNFKTDRQYGAVVLLVSLLFAAGAVYPYRVEADAAYQIKSVLQFLSGQSHTLNALAFADPADLSRDVQTWLFWWPPLMSVVLLPLLKMGLGTGGAIRLAVFLATLSGSLGWMAVARLVLRTSRAKWLALIPILLLPITLGTTTACRTFDIFPFAIEPWLYLGALHLTCRYAGRQHQTSLIRLQTGFFCFGLGAMFWLKSTSLFASLALLFFLLTSLVFSAISRRQQVATATLAVVTFGIPVFSLVALNQHYSHKSSVVGTHSQLGHTPPLYNVVLSTLGGPGVSLFGIEESVRHIYLYKMGIGGPDALKHNTNPLAYIGIPGTIIIAALLGWIVKSFGLRIGLLAFLTLAVPMLIFGYLMYRTGLAYPIDATRHVVPYWIFVEILAIGFVDEFLPRKHCRLAWFGLGTAVLYFLVPVSYDLYSYARFDVTGRLLNPYTSSPNHLYVPNFSMANSASVRSKILSLIRSPDDLVVIATPFCGMETWLELPGRLLPLTTFWMPLEQTHGREGASFRGRQPLVSLQDLHIILVVSDTDSTSDQAACVRRMLHRFPQISTWKPVAHPESSSVSIYSGDLRVASAAASGPSQRVR